MFGKCGKINSVSVPLDKYTGRNKGFAFIAFDERSGAEQAKDM
jgi:RNA recognition motif-containing protein